MATFSYNIPGKAVRVKYQLFVQLEKLLNRIFADQDASKPVQNVDTVLLQIFLKRLSFGPTIMHQLLDDRDFAQEQLHKIEDRVDEFRERYFNGTNHSLLRAQYYMDQNITKYFIEDDLDADLVNELASEPSDVIVSLEYLIFQKFHNYIWTGTLDGLIEGYRRNFYTVRYAEYNISTGIYVVGALKAGKPVDQLYVESIPQERLARVFLLFGRDIPEKLFDEHVLTYAEAHIYATIGGNKSLMLRYENLARQSGQPIDYENILKIALIQTPIITSETVEYLIFNLKNPTPELFKNITVALIKLNNLKFLPLIYKLVRNFEAAQRGVQSRLDDFNRNCLGQAMISANYEVYFLFAGSLSLLPSDLFRQKDIDIFNDFDFHMMLRDEYKPQTFDFTAMVIRYSVTRRMSPLNLKNNRLKNQRIIEQLNYIQAASLRDGRTLNYIETVSHLAMINSQEITNWVIDQIWQLRLYLSINSLIYSVLTTKLTLENVTMLVKAVKRHPFDLDESEYNIFDRIKLEQLNSTDLVAKMIQLKKLVSDDIFYQNFLTFLESKKFTMPPTDWLQNFYPVESWLRALVKS